MFNSDTPRPTDSFFSFTFVPYFDQGLWPVLTCGDSFTLRLNESVNQSFSEDFRPNRDASRASCCGRVILNPIGFAADMETEPYAL